MFTLNVIPYYFLFDVYFELGYELKDFKQQLHYRNQYHGLKLNYYKEKYDYIFSCIDDNWTISVEFFKENYINYNYTFKYSEWENINEY